MREFCSRDEATLSMLAPSTGSSKQVEQYKKLEKKKIPADFDYDAVPSLRIEARQKLKKIRPVSIGQASRISGVSPADINVLVVFMKL